MDQAAENESIELIIGTEVVGNDGALGELKRVVVDPAARAITHLVVGPRHRRGAGHLVPVELVVSAAAQEIRLRCTTSELATLDHAEDIEFQPGANGAWNYQQSQTLTLPRYPLGMGLGMGTGGAGMSTGGVAMGAGPHAVISDRVPDGEIEVRQGEHVHATDGPIGRVRGLVVGPSSHGVTHILLEEGHLWGRKRVSIPISAVTRVDDGVRLSLSKQEIEDLPAVDLDDLT